MTLFPFKGSLVIKGISLEEFTERKILYLTLTNILKCEEIWFVEESLGAGFNSFNYNVCNWDVDHPYPLHRFGISDYQFSDDNTVKYLFGIVWN